MTESTGAMAVPLVALLRTLGRASVAPGTHDATVYGTSRASPRAFRDHHTAAISSAIVCADALVIETAAATIGFKLSMGMPAID